MNEQIKPKTAVAIAWYRSSEWVELKAFCDDRNELENKYEEWKSNAETGLRDIKKRGIPVETVDFNLKEFKLWCQANRKLPIAASRSEFVALKLRQRHKSNV